MRIAPLSFEANHCQHSSKQPNWPSILFHNVSHTITDKFLVFLLLVIFRFDTQVPLRRNEGFPPRRRIVRISAVLTFVSKRQLLLAPACSGAWKHQCHTRCFPIKAPWCNVGVGPRCSRNFKAAPLTSLDTLQRARLYWQLRRICDGFLFWSELIKGSTHWQRHFFFLGIFKKKKKTRQKHCRKRLFNWIPVQNDSNKFI